MTLKQKVTQLLLLVCMFALYVGGAAAAPIDDGQPLVEVARTVETMLDGQPLVEVAR